MQTTTPRVTPAASDFEIASEWIAAELLHYRSDRYPDAHHLTRQLSVLASGQVGRERAIDLGLCVDEPRPSRLTDGLFDHMFDIASQIEDALGSPSTERLAELRLGLAISEARAMTQAAYPAIRWLADQITGQPDLANEPRGDIDQLVRQALGIIPLPLASTMPIARRAERLRIAAEAVAAVMLDAGIVLVAVDTRRMATCAVCGMELGPEHIPRWPLESLDDWTTRRTGETRRRWDLVHQAGAEAVRRVLGDASSTETSHGPVDSDSLEASPLGDAVWSVIVRMERWLARRWDSRRRRRPSYRRSVACSCRAIAGPDGSDRPSEHPGNMLASTQNG